MDREEVKSIQRELKSTMVDGKNTNHERTGNNLQQKQSEGGMECDEHNRAGTQAKQREEQVDCLQGKQLAKIYYTI